MDRDVAIGYLERKDKIRELEEGEKYTKEEEREIQKVMVHGKVYGDPIFQLDF